MSYRPDDECSEYGRLLVVTERLYDAIMARDAGMVRALIDTSIASSIPREVREEALAVLTLPASSYRAPMRLLQFQHRLTELLRDADVEAAMGQMEIPW